MTPPTPKPASPGPATIDPTAVVAADAVCHPGSWIGPDVVIGPGCTIGPGAVIALPGPDNPAGPVQIGSGVWIGPNVFIEPGVTIGDGCAINACSVLRFRTALGSGTRLGARCTIMGNSTLGNHVNLEAEVHVGEFSTLEDYCQLMPGSILLNDPYPPTALDPMGPTIGPCSIVGVNAVIYPRVRLGYHAMVGALSVVKQDVADYALVVGSPAKPICDVRRIRYKLGEDWVYPYPWMRHRIPGEDITRPSG